MARPTPLPELVTVGQLMEEMKISRAAARKIFRQLPEQRIPGYTRTFVLRGDVVAMLERNHHVKRLAG